MRFLAVGDLHGDTDTLFRLLDTEQADGLLCVGDWGDPGEIADRAFQEIISRIPVLTVFGNHDDLPALAALHNRDGSPILLESGERRADFAGLSVGGVSGIRAKTNRLPHYVTDEDVAGFAYELSVSGPIDVLLTHGCPIGYADRTPSGRPGGQRCFLDLARAVQPRIHLCGHLHISQERKLSATTVIINTGALPDGHYVVISTGESGPTAERRHLTLAPSHSS